MEATITFKPLPFHVAKGDVRISATMFDVDNNTGKALNVKRVVVDERRADMLCDEDDD